MRIIRARRRRENFENNKNRDLPARRRRNFFRGILRQKRGFCLKIDLRRAQIWPSEKNIIIRARRRRNFFWNNKSKPRFLPGFFRIIRTHEKSRAQKSLRGGFIINSPVWGFDFQWNPYVKSGKFVDFPKIVQLQKLKSRFLHEKIIFFALDFFLVKVWLWGFDF